MASLELGEMGHSSLHREWHYVPFQKGLKEAMPKLERGKVLQKSRIRGPGEKGLKEVNYT